MTGEIMSSADDIASSSDAWVALRRHTVARIALGRTGASLPTHEVLAFGVAHAQARDAVHAALDVDALASELEAFAGPSLRVASAAADRAAYLSRPDWGRRLDAASIEGMTAVRTEPAADVVFVISDGLSAIAAQRHAEPLLRTLWPLLARYRIAPLVIATQARVALSDEVGELLGARMAISLIGERPGLTTADSLGIYLTYAPKVGRNDAERNCISNVRPEGLPLAEAALQVAALIDAAFSAGTSGVRLRFDAAKRLQGPL